MASLFSRDHTRAVIDALHKSQAVVEFKLDGTVLAANAKFLNIFNYTLAEVKGKHHRMFVEPSFVNSSGYRGFWDALNRGEYQSGQFKRLGKNGKEIWIEASYNPIVGFSGKPVKVVKVAADVTSQKADYADLVGKVNAIGKSQAIMEFSLDGTVITANDVFLNVLGYQLAEIQGRHHSMFVDPPTARSPEYQSFWNALKRGEFQVARYRRVGKNGKECWIEASYNPIFDLNGKPWKIVKFATDLSNRKAENSRLADEFENGVKALVGTVALSANQMQATAETLSVAAEETNRQSVTVAAASEQLTASVDEISRQLAVVTELVGVAVGEAEKSESKVARLVETADKIGAVTQMIARIAGQTNLLALNATIEAARAGDAGRGFAIVAAEVKVLANQTATATREIEQQISGIQDSSKMTATAIEQIVNVITKIREVNLAVSEAIKEQSMASHQVASSIISFAAAAEETGRSSCGVLIGAQTLRDRSSDLQGQVDKFLVDVRAM